MRFWNFFLIESTGNGLKKVTFSSWNKLNAEQRKSKTTDFVRHFFSFDTWKQTFLSNTELRSACSINESGLAYGPNANFWDLTVKCSPPLRAKRQFLRFARNLRPHCFGESKRVEHFLNFLDFCSTFKAARPVFGGVGRIFSQFFGFVFYFQGSTPQFWKVRQTKIRLPPLPLSFFGRFDTRKWKQTFSAYFKHNRELGLYTQKKPD